MLGLGTAGARARPEGPLTQLPEPTRKGMAPRCCTKPTFGKKKSMIFSSGPQALTFPSSCPPCRQQGLGAASGASLDGELLSCPGNGDFLYKQYPGFFNALPLKFNVLSPLRQQLLLRQEKLVNFESGGWCFAGGAPRCLNTGSWVPEQPLVCRTVIPPRCPRAGGPGEPPRQGSRFFRGSFVSHFQKFFKASP